MSEIEFHFKKGGVVKMEAKGIPGAACQKATSKYRERLLGQVTSDTPTEEMYQAEQDHEQQNEQTKEFGS
jgi:hypothetical protein